MKVLRIASLGKVTEAGNQTVKTIAGLQVFVPENLVGGIDVGEHMVVIDQVISQRRAFDANGNALDNEDGSPKYVPIVNEAGEPISQVRKTATFIGSEEECLDMATEEAMSQVISEEYVVLKKEEKLAELRAKFAKQAKTAGKAAATEEAVIK